MTWKKIDDYCGSAYTELQPYSAFVAQGLTNNARSYPEELFRGTSRAFRAGTTGCKFAAWGEASGTIVWVNCGINATRVQFKIRYATATSHEVDSRMGTWVVRHVSSTQTVIADARADTGGTELTVDWTPNTNPLSGYQAFFVGFQSARLDNLGAVTVFYVNNNNVGLGPVTDGYTLTTGEKWELLVLDPTSAALQEVEFNSTAWQIGWMEYRGDTPTIAVVWPGDVVYPDMTANNPSNKDMFGNIYELGTVLLLSISYELTEAQPNNLVDQLNHYDAIALTGVNTAQSTTIPAYYPEISSGVCEPYHLGRYLDVQPDAITATFSFQADTTASVEVIVTAVYTARVGSARTQNQTLTLDVLDQTGTSVLVDPITQNFTMRQYSTDSRSYGDMYSFRALMGIYVVPNQWGFRDAVPISDIGKGSTISVATPPIYFNSVDNEGVYTLKVTGGGIYVFGFSARLV